MTVLRSRPRTASPAPPPAAGSIERVGHRRLSQQVLGLDINDDRTVIGDQEVIRDVLTDLPVYLRLQQERLRQDAMHRPVEVREDQPTCSRRDS